MTPFEKQIWSAVFGSRVVQRGWPITHDDLSRAIRLADSTIIAMRGRNRTHGNDQLESELIDQLEAEQFAQQPCQPPENAVELAENAVELATRLRTELVETGGATVHRGDIMPLLNMVIGTPNDVVGRTTTPSIPGHPEGTTPSQVDNPYHPRT